ncbi:DUF2950 domain-containing protein [Lysobacter auxotrophicus]|uniref:DUF2950 domain-containing protein n=1 Tax=Lysobacter auxotrophicus TaxID=2992573 RepID=A0ABN6UJE4_9GAMM|nr:DUF2950 domain-containing protein [Lysobacter auxotrophicus]BDU16433.1 DUF2950 domain-containing protein [Lysobacter auxotrophicus]
MSASVRWLPLVLALSLAWPASAQEPFPTPDAAAQALVAALGTKTADEAKLTALLGPSWEQVVPRGSVDREDVDAFLARYREKHAFVQKDATHQMLAVGNDAWTLPVPLVKGASGWTFDVKAGEPEIRARRIGRNEREAEQAVLAYHDAQVDYASADRNGNGVLEYAQKFVSSDGQHDGLYWADDDGEESPLGPLFGDDTPNGEWHGYRYRILTAQGPSAPGGAYDYKLGDAMSRGFALVAWPAKYGDTGVMSFMISHEGEVFEKDLGPQGEQVARSMKAFDPDSSWVEVKDAQTAGTSR